VSFKKLQIELKVTFVNGAEGRYMVDCFNPKDVRPNQILSWGNKEKGKLFNMRNVLSISYEKVKQ